MKPQLYSIVILLLARINYVQNAENSTQASAQTSTKLPLIPPANTTTSVAKPPEGNVTSITKAPDGHKTSAPATPENEVTVVTEAPKGNTTSVTKTSRAILLSKIPTNKLTVLSEAPNSKATPAPSLATDVSPFRTTKGFTVTTGSGGIPRATGSTSVSVGNQTSKPIVAGNATTQQIIEVTNALLKTTRPTPTKLQPTTEKTTGNRTSAFPVPSLFAIVLLVVSVLCF